MNEALETNDQIFGNSWAICLMVAPNFYGVIVVLYGDVLNSIFPITLIIFVKYLLRNSCDGLDFITTGLN